MADLYVLSLAHCFTCALGFQGSDTEEEEREKEKDLKFESRRLLNGFWNWELKLA